MQGMEQIAATWWSRANSGCLWQLSR